MMMTLIIVLVILILVFFLIGNYFCNIALNPKVSKNYILRSLTDEEQLEENKCNTEGQEWLNTFAKEVDILSIDNLRLHGYEIQNPMKKTKNWVILVHGYMGKSCEMIGFAKEFIDRGYNTLLIDLRAHGKSEGKYIGMGWQDRLDLQKWTQYLCIEYMNCNIILFGVSMGAATVMMTIGEKLPSNVKIAIADCGYSSVYRQFKLLLKTLKPCIAEYLINAASMVTKLKVGYNFKEASAVNQLKKSSIPILFIHGDADKFVPFEMLDEVYKVAPEPKEKLIIKDAGHVKSSKVNPKLYWKTIEGFIKKNMK